MTHAEFLTKMLNLERAINDLQEALEKELYDEGTALDDNLWLIAHSAVELTRGMTNTKYAIGNIHDQVYGK